MVRNLTNLLLYGAGIFATMAGPAGIAALLYFSSAPWFDTLRSFQGLAAGMVALTAAGLAFLGVCTTVSNQRKLQKEQMLATRRRSASAFIGEIQ